NINLPLRVNFMTTSSYGNNEESTGRVKVVSDVTTDIAGYDVLGMKAYLTLLLYRLYKYCS
ncbi:hypothetical protein ACTPEM_22885, partial [Clostridioides difficile]